MKNPLLFYVHTWDDSIQLPHALVIGPSGVRYKLSEPSDLRRLADDLGYDTQTGGE